MNEEKFHRQIFNGVTILSGLLILITWAPSQSTFFELLIMIGYCGSLISFIYGMVFLIIRYKTRKEKRLYNTLLSSKIVSFIALVFYLIEIWAIMYLGLLLFLGPGPGAMR